MNYPISSIRLQFPALRKGGALFDGPGGTQTPERVARAIYNAMTDSVSQRGLNNFSELSADRIVTSARQAMADLLGVKPDAVAFGRSATQITFDVARAFAKKLQPGDEIVASRLDHDANVRPWVDAAAASGATLRWIDFDRETGDLTVDDVRRVLSDRTKIVAVTSASNLYGTRPDIPAIAAAVHAVGAEIYVDAVALTAHAFIDFGTLGADYLVCSPYKFCGPHIGVLASRRETLENLEPAKLAPSTNQVPERFELGTLPYELLAGITEAVEFLADLVPSEGTRRERLAHSYEQLEEYEERLFERLLVGLAAIPGVHRVGAPASAVPTVLFRIDGRSSSEVCAALGQANVAAMGGTFYSMEAENWAELTGLGLVRAGIAPYTSIDDVERLLTAVASIADSTVTASITTNRTMKGYEQ